MIASASKIKLFKSCRRAYEFRYVYDLRPIETAEALQTGSNYHALIEELYNDDEAYLFTHADDYSKEKAMATAYRKYIYPKFKVRSTEEWHQARIGKHALVGRVDGIAEDGLLVEHKTTSQEITEEYEYDLQWDEQILAYMYLTGSRSVYYTVIRKPTIRQKKNETDEEFYNRMVEWYDEDTDKKIRLLKISRTDEEIQQFAESFKMICGEMERGVIYRNPSYCNHWGRKCEYASICLNYDPDQEYVGFVKGEEK